MSTIAVCALVAALFAVQVISGKKYEPQFEYEYRVLETLVKQEEEMEKMRTAFKEANERNAEMNEMLEATYDTISHLNATVNILRSNNLGSGSTYIRWGRTTCDGDAEVVYDGYAAGSHYNHKGSGSNYLCLTREPKWGDQVSSSVGLLYGVEYEFGGKHQDQDAPCVVCRISRSSVLMTPGTNECQDGWVQEYSGYLVSAYYGYFRTEFVCMDKDIEYLNSGSANHNGAMIYHVQGACGSLRCPPYANKRDYTCVVCSYGKRG